MVKRRIRLFTVLAILALVMATGLTLALFSPGENAGAAANPNGNTAGVVEHASGGLQQVVYFPAGVKTPVGLNTPIVSPKICGLGDNTKFAVQVALVGTMTGTNPTLATQWRQSYDNGVTWVNIGAAGTINATVTPASQLQQVSDVYSSTATVMGDCYDATLTFGGTGSVGANVSVIGIVKP